MVLLTWAGVQFALDAWVSDETLVHHQLVFPLRAQQEPHSHRLLPARAAVPGRNPAQYLRSEERGETMIPEQLAAVMMMAILLIMVIGGVHLAFSLMFLAVVVGLLYQGTMFFPHVHAPGVRDHGKRGADRGPPLCFHGHLARKDRRHRRRLPEPLRGVRPRPGGAGRRHHHHLHGLRRLHRGHRRHRDHHDAGGRSLHDQARLQQGAGDRGGVRRRQPGDSHPAERDAGHVRSDGQPLGGPAFCGRPLPRPAAGRSLPGLYRDRLLAESLPGTRHRKT